MSSRLTLFILAVLLVDFTSAIECFNSNKGKSETCGMGFTTCGVNRDHTRSCYGTCMKQHEGNCGYDEVECCCRSDNCNAPTTPAPPTTTPIPTTTTTNATEAPTTTTTVPETTTSQAVKGGAQQTGMWMGISFFIVINIFRI